MKKLINEGRLVEAVLESKGIEFDADEMYAMVEDNFYNNDVNICGINFNLQLLHSNWFNIMEAHGIKLIDWQNARFGLEKQTREAFVADLERYYQGEFEKYLNA